MNYREAYHMTYEEKQDAALEAKAEAERAIQRTAQPVLDAIKAAAATDEGLSAEVVAHILATLAYEFACTPVGSVAMRGGEAIDLMNQAESVLDELAAELAKGDRE